MPCLPVLRGWPLLLLPVHILFLQLVIDPACAIVFEAEALEDGAMRGPPGGKLVERAMLIRGLAQSTH